MAYQPRMIERAMPDPQQPMSVINFAAMMFGLFVFIIVGLTVIFGSWYTIDQTERGVLLRYGAVVDVVQPGLHFKMPWVESVTKIDMQTKNFEYQKVNSYSADQQPADLKISVTLHVNPGKEQEMYARFGGDEAAAVSRLITPHMYQEVKVVFGQYTAQRAITDRGKLNVDAAEALKNAIAYDPIFTLEGVQIEDINFSPDYILSVEARMQAEVQVQQKQQELLQEKIKADIALAQANGRANSVRAEAQASADATRMNGEAKAAIIKITGEAEAAAIQARANALGSNPNLISLTWAERWNGVGPTTMIPGAATPMVAVK
jgi:regulator of protease activity HflC (stomatin/prohibitin superfamily)